MKCVKHNYHEEPMKEISWSLNIIIAVSFLTKEGLDIYVEL